MKKYLIALPLVLIMILSMVPVMAAEDLVVNVSYYDTPNKTKVIQTKKVVVSPTDEQAKDAKALESLIEKAIRDEGFPVLKTDVQPAWDVKVTATAQSQGKTTYDQASTNLGANTYAALLAFATKHDISFNTINVKPAMIQGDDATHKYIADGFITAFNNLIAAIAADPKTEKELVVQEAWLAATEADAATDLVVHYLVPQDGEVKPASATAVAFPKCFVDPKTEEESFCPELCDFITVKVINAFNGKEIVDAAKKYKVEPKKLPTFDGIYNHYMSNYFPAGYQVLKNWDLQNKIKFPTAIEKDCTITIWVLPQRQVVDVLHVLMNCCETPDGTMSYPVWKKFIELNVTVDFIDFHSTFVVDSNKAAEWAATRLQKINATDFVFTRALFDDGLRLDSYMTGEVYDMNGNKIDTISNTNPKIILEYLRSECVKEEEQVDNATVENNANTQAPVTASGTQLPATGAKDVTAFFLSAVALLGLGIFFAKKH